MELLNQEKIQGKYTTIQNEEIDVEFDVFTLATAPGFAENILKEVQKTVKIHGFREGKVPKAIIEKRLGTHNIYGQHLGSVWDDFCLKNNVLTGFKTELDDIQTRIDGAIVFKIVTITIPSAELVLREKYELDVTQNVIEKTAQQLQALTNKYVSMIPATDRASRWGDIVTIDFNGIVDGVEDPDLCANDAKIEIGARRIKMPNFEESLCDMQINENKEFLVDVPENFAEIMPNNPRAGLVAGKTITFNVVLKTIEEKKIPQEAELAEKEGKSSISELYNELADKSFETIKDNLDDICSRVSDDIIRDNETLLTSVVQKPLIESRVVTFLDRNKQYFEKMEQEEVQEYLKKSIPSIAKGVFQDVVYNYLLNHSDAATIEVTEAEIVEEADKYAMQQMIYSQGKVKKDEAKNRLLQQDQFMLFRSVQRRKVYSLLRDRIDVILNKEDSNYVLTSSFTENETKLVPTEAEGKEMIAETTVAPIETEVAKQEE